MAETPRKVKNDILSLIPFFFVPANLWAQLFNLAKQGYCIDRVCVCVFMCVRGPVIYMDEYMDTL